MAAQKGKDLLIKIADGAGFTAIAYGVNSGASRAGKVLRRVLGMADSEWAVTQAVLTAAAKADDKALIGAINDERIAFLRSLKTWPVFGAGWGCRVAEVRASSLALANNTRAPSSTTGSLARGKGQVLPPPATKQIAVGAGVAGGVSAAVLAFADAHRALIVSAAVFAVVLVLTIVFALRWRWRARRDAALPREEVSR